MLMPLMLELTSSALNVAILEDGAREEDSEDNEDGSNCESIPVNPSHSPAPRPWG